jgi:thiosulfate/3-mercaptopyruvate sulfurtransferase
MSVRETPYETLIEPAQVHAHLHDPQWIVIDCRFDLARPEAGREAYERGHIPDARYAHLEKDLSGAVTPETGRHPLPQPDALAAQLDRWGIDQSTQVVAYDEANGAFASRLWWLLRWLGHRKVAVLNGGFKAWRQAGYPQDTQVPAETRAAKSSRRIASQDWLTTSQVQKELAAGTLALIDARSADRFAGQNETIDPVAGHVPGAANHPFLANLDAEQRFLPAALLRERWTQTLNGRPATTVVCMCGSGVTACHNLLALEAAGFKGARLYAGSWSEWIRDRTRPVATGAASGGTPRDER